MSVSRTGRTSFILWFLLMCECLPLCDSDTVMHGELHSPQYPEPYPPNALKQWDLTVPEGFQIRLTFIHLDIEASDGCYKDSLTVLYNGKLLWKFCGNENSGDGNHPGHQPILSPGNSLTLIFQSDDSNPERHQNVGFFAQFQAIGMKCPMPGSVTRGRVIPSMTEYFYRDHIYVRCDQGYKLMMNGQEIKTFSTVCQSNGQWHLPLPECHIIDCGDPEPLLNGGLTFLSGSQNQYLSLVQYHCNEPFYSLEGDQNVTFTCEADRQWRSNDLAVTKPTCLPVCGQPTEEIREFLRIFGGKDAPQNTIPWQVLLIIGSGRGGGIIIADKWIMTAASVLAYGGQQVSKDLVKIYVGGTDVRAMINSPLYAESIHVHPDYDSVDDKSYNNDIALIKLVNPLTFRAAVMPVCLPAKDSSYTTGKIGLVSGFGLVNNNGSRMLTNRLKYVQLPLVDHKSCNDSFNSLKKKNYKVPHLTNNMFCAGTPEGGKDACQGDSGSPFTMTENKQFWVAGIVSWGVDCGMPGAYGVYTKVDEYLDWINRTMQEN